MEAWHALLAPLPPEATPCRQPVAPPEVLATPAGAAVAGWEQLVVELSAGAAGLRVVMVVLDATGQPISASDMVLYRSEVAGGTGAEGACSSVEIHQESVGGRLEPDGMFRGTHWRMVGREPIDDEDPKWESTPSEPSVAEVAGLKALVAELLRRQSRITGRPSFPGLDRGV
jgi:hypothetical protein